MMHIRQLQVANDSMQDRLILRISTDAQEEVRVYFTRRFLRELWPGLTRTLADLLAHEVPGNPSTVEMVAPDQMDELADLDGDLEDADENEDGEDDAEEGVEAATDDPPRASPNVGLPSFDHAFQNSNATYPLGANPLLATEATLTPISETKVTFTVREGRERNFSMNFNSEMLQALCSMLRAAADQSLWDLELDYADRTSNQGEAARPTTTRSTLLH